MNGQDLIQLINNGNFPTYLAWGTNVFASVMSIFLVGRKRKIETSVQGIEKLKVNLLDEVAKELLDEGKLTYLELYKIKNYKKIAELADEEFAKKGPISDIPEQDFDWHSRFFESCGYVSDEDMQRLWARILAGEIESPGSYSLRTIECLRNLSKKEALLFKKICEVSIAAGRNVVLPHIDSYLNSNKISYDDILKMDDCGLMDSSSSLTRKIDIKHDKMGIVAFNKKCALLVKPIHESAESKILNLNEYRFSKNGAELFSVLESANDYKELCEILSQNYPDYKFISRKVISREGDSICVDIKE